MDRNYRDGLSALKSVVGYFVGCVVGFGMGCDMVRSLGQEVDVKMYQLYWVLYLPLRLDNRQGPRGDLCW